MKQKPYKQEPQRRPASRIPDIDIIDLEQEASSEAHAFGADCEPIDPPFSQNSSQNLDKKAKKEGLWRKFLNFHVLFILIVIVIIMVIVGRFKNWGLFIAQEDISFEGQDLDNDTFDQPLPLLDADGTILNTNIENPVIVAFGNAPFADDRNSDDSLASLIEKYTDGTVYNCAVSGSYLAAQSYAYDSSTFPMDAYCFYWLATLATGGDIEYYYDGAAQALGDSLPPESDEVIQTLTTLDFNTVDVVTIMYDATDYLMGHNMYSDENDTDTLQFTGNLEAGIELLQSVYPHIRIIVMSPAYAYAVDDDGNYVSSDKYTYGQDVLSTYVIKQGGSCMSRSVSFIDHLYGSITEDNAEAYLLDNLHLNVKGRDLVAKRFTYFLNYYNK